MFAFIWFWYSTLKARKYVKNRIKELGDPSIYNRHDYEKLSKWATKEQLEILVLWALFFIAENLAYFVILQRFLLDK